MIDDPLYSSNEQTNLLSDIITMLKGSLVLVHHMIDKLARTND